MDLNRFLESIKAKGVELNINEDNRFSYLDPENVLIQSEISKIRHHKREILKILKEDFVRWNNDIKNTNDWEEHKSYWQGQLSDELPVLNLPADYTRPPFKTFTCENISFELSKELVKKLSKAENTTIFSTLLSAFYILLYRYTDQKDIIVVTPGEVKIKEEFKSLVDIFTNMMPLRADLSDNPFFKEFLSQIHHTVFKAAQHRSYPVSPMIKKSGQINDSVYSPPFQVMFAVKTLSGESSDLSDKINIPADWAGLKTDLFETETQESQFDLSLEVLNM